MLLVITGEGGSGKTRLAIELGRRLREEGWRYCFIAANDGDDDLRPLFSHDATPIFAVADYALRVKRRVKQFVSAAAKDGWHGKPFCLALLDRKTPDYVAELEKPTDSDPDGVGQKIPFNPIRVELKGLEEDEARALFGSTVRELARRYDLTLPPDIEEKWLLLRKSAHLCPLNVTLGALLAVRGTLDRPLSDEEILSEALKSEVKDRWMAQGMEEDAIPRAMDIEQSEEYEQALKLLAAYVALRGHTAVSELQQAATELITPSLFPYIGDGKVHQLAILLCKMLPKTGYPRVCIPLEPDPVADFMLNEMRSTWPQRFGQVLERVLDGILNEYAQMHDRGDQERAKATLRTQAEQVLNVLERAFPEGEFLLQVSTDVAQHTGMSGLAMFAGALARKGQDAIKTLHDVLDPPIPDPNAPLLNTFLHVVVFLSKAYAADTDEDRAASYGTAGNVLSNLGRHQEALEPAQKAAELCQQLADQNPTRFLPDLAGSLGNLATILSNLGKRQAALERAQETAELFELLSRRSPERFLTDLAASYNNLANRYADLGRYREALEYNQRAVEIRVELARKNPTLFSADFARSLNNLANRLSALGRDREALKPAQQAATIYEQLAKKNPRTFLPDLAMSCVTLANRLAGLGRYHEALDHARHAVEIRLQLVEENAQAFLPDLAGSLNNLAVLLSVNGRHQEVLEPALRAVRIYEQLAKKNPTRFLPDLAGSLGTLANTFADLGRHQEALEPSQRSVELYKQLAEENPTRFLPDLAGSLGTLANTFADLGRHQEALEPSQRSVELYKQLAEENPIRFNPDLALSLNNLADTLSDLGRHPEALEPAQRAIELYQKLAEQNPTRFNSDLARALGLTANILNAAGRYQEAFSRAEDGLRKLKDHFFQLPQAYAGLMRLILTVYENARKHCGCEPDMELVNPIIEKLREL